MSDAHDGTGAGMLMFLEWAGSRGEMNPETSKAFRVACNRVLEAEASPEAVDIRELDVESLLERFETLRRTRYSTGSMNTYKSRFRQSVAMYRAWLNKEPSWKHAGKDPRARKASESRAQRKAGRAKTKASGGSSSDLASDHPSVVPASATFPDTQMVVYDLPLRPDMLVRITLPFDLTSSDAERIAAFVRSLAFDPNGE